MQALHGPYSLCRRCQRELEEDIAKWALRIGDDLKLLELFDEYLARRCPKPPPSEN